MGQRKKKTKQQTKHFGCSQCWDGSAAAAWHQSMRLQRERMLIDQSHFSVEIKTCRQCKQQFLLIYTEMIVWDGGEDTQESTIMPLTDAEAAAFAKPGADVHALVRQLPKSRKSLRNWSPAAEGSGVIWGQGAEIGMHD